MKRAPDLPKKEDAPEALLRSVDGARARTRSRRHGPPVEFKRNVDGGLIRDDKGDPIWDWPFLESGPDGSPSWSWLVLDAFGTRNPIIATVFVNYLLKLVGKEWDGDKEEWIPDDRELQTLLHVISAHKPKNEMQAAMAAERAATMLLTMKLAEQVSRYPYDAKSVASYARLAVAGAMQSRALLETQGKRKTSSQKITVKRENHVHYHDHRTGGAAESDGQPRATDGGETSERPSLPCHDKGGQVVLLPGCQGPESLPHARRTGRGS